MSVDVPVSIWQATNGLTDFSSGGVYDIDDPSGVFLVDPSAVNIVDTGVIATLIPTTPWAEDNSIQMANKVIGDYTAAITIDGATHFLLIQPGNSSTAYKKISRNVLLGVTGQPADISTTQSFTNKTLDNTNAVTLKDTLFILQDDSDTTKQAKFQLSGITTATTRTYTLPNASSTLVDIATTQTLTNKTLTNPVINGGSVSGSTVSVDAVNEFTSSNGVTISGLNVKTGKLNTNNSVVTANITDAAVTPAKLQAGTGSGWTWASWTPSWTNVTVGNGTVVAKYVQTGKMVTCRISFILGSTSAISGLPTFSLPITAVSYPNIANGADPLGIADVLDSGTGTFPGDIRLLTTTTAILTVWAAGSTYVTGINPSSTIPMTWTTNDALTATFTYEAAQ